VDGSIPRRLALPSSTQLGMASIASAALDWDQPVAAYQVRREALVEDPLAEEVWRQQED